MNKTIERQRLLDIISHYRLENKSVAIFGTGALAETIKNQLNRLGVTVAAFIDRIGHPPVDGIPVIAEDNIREPGEWRGIIISSLLYQDIIADRLEKKLGNTVPLIKLEPGLDWETARFIKPETMGDEIITVLFVKQALHIRVQKHALALKQSSNIRSVLITARPADLIEDAFDEIYIYNSERGLINLLSTQTPDVCLAYDLPNKVPRRCIEYLSAPVIYASHDSEPCHLIGLKEGCRPHFSADDSDIAYVLKHAAGITYKGDEISCLESRYEITSPQLRFDCYIQDRFIQPQRKKLSREDGQIHVVQGGGVFSMKLDTATSCVSQYLHIAPYFTSKGIHYHLYPASITANSDYEEYYRYRDENPFFHFHEPLDYFQFLRELTLYDFAVPIHETRPRWQNPVLFDLIFPSKIFAFIEAGIPFISNCRYTGQFGEENGIGLLVPLDQLDNIDSIIARADRAQMTANIQKAREKFNIRHFQKELESFIYSIIKQYP